MLLEWNDHCLTDYDRLFKSVNLWNSHAGLAPVASNIPNEIQMLNWGLIWSFHYSSEKRIIEIITEIKFAIINLLIHSWGERLTCFDCSYKDNISLPSITTFVHELKVQTQFPSEMISSQYISSFWIFFYSGTFSRPSINWLWNVSWQSSHQILGRL